jgi:hypothetical protein
VDSCSHCGGDLPDHAVFCPSCGRRTDARTTDAPIEIQHAEPRYFGLGQPIFVFSLAVGLLVLGVVLLVLGSVIAGVLAIAFAISLLPAFLAGARRWPDTRIARLGISTAARVRDESDVAVASISTWSRAGREVVKLRKENFRLRRERDAKIQELGVSAFEDDGRAEEIKGAAKALDERIAANERELQRTIAGARRRVRQGRAAVAPTEVIKPESDESDPVEVDAAEAASGEGRSTDPADDVADAVDVEQRS